MGVEGGRWLRQPLPLSREVRQLRLGRGRLPSPATSVRAEHAEIRSGRASKGLSNLLEHQARAGFVAEYSDANPQLSLFGPGRV